MSGFSRLSGFREHSDLWQCFLPLGAKWMVKIRLRVIKKIPDVGSMWSSPQTRCHVYVAPLGVHHVWSTWRVVEVGSEG